MLAASTDKPVLVFDGCTFTRVLSMQQCYPVETIGSFYSLSVKINLPEVADVHLKHLVT